MLRYYLILVFTAFIFASAVAEDEAPVADGVSSEELIQYMEHMISGHRQAMSLEAAVNNSREVLITENLRQNSSKAINYAFDFARAQSAALESKPSNVYGPVMEAGRRQNLLKVSVTVDQHIKDVQQNLDDLNNKIASAKPKDKNRLVATRDKMNSELKLAKAQGELIQNILSLSNNSIDDEVGLLKKINGLARTVPEVVNEQQRKSAKNDNAPNVVVPQKIAANTSRGIISLVSDLVTNFSKKNTVKSSANSNAKLRIESQVLLNALRNQLKAGIKLGDEITKTVGDSEQQKKQLDGLVTEFKLLGSAVIPLNQAIIWQDATSRNYSEWNDLLDQNLNNTLHILAIKLVILAIAIAIPIILSRLSQRTIIKYVKDGRRQRQLQTLRKILFSVVIGLVILLNLITESGSLLMFAGFLTAGLAVALQNVILSLFAHFFYFGRFGVREGDRVTVGGITGEVIKIGMVRLYVMELAAKDFDFYPTGRIVTFPNSILFQPAAFTKLVPGTSFTWNEIRIMLDQETDFDLANKKLLEAVELVYKEYEEDMKHQQEALQRSTHLNVSIPGPTGYVKFVDAGLAFVVRYPVAIGDSAEVHDRITRKLIDAIRAEPLLKLRG